MRLLDRRRALMATQDSGPYGLRDGTYTDQANGGTVEVTNSNTTKLNGLLNEDQYMIKLLRPINTGNNAYINQTNSYYRLNTKIKFWYGDGTSETVNVTLNNSGVHTAIQAGKRLKGISFGHTSNFNNNTIGWSITVDGTTLF